MSKMNFEEVADRAIQISELIEEIIQLDELIALHSSYGADDNDISVIQYKDRRQEFIEQLNALLVEHHLKVIVEDKAA